MKRRVVLILLLVGTIFTSFASIQDPSRFNVGTSKVDVTPNDDELPKGYFKINDKLFVRSIFIENETSSSVLIAVDIGMIRNDFYDKITQRIEKELGVPALNVYLFPSHTHSAPWGSSPELEEAVFESVKSAKANKQSAVLSYNTGLSYINVNRDVIDPETRLWSQGPNYDGPSDKTVSVIKFSDKEGNPIAVFYNYAMHANMMFMSGSISSDFTGVASKYVEDYYGNDLVAMFSSGAAGDQNPISVHPMGEVSQQKTDALLKSGKAKERGEAIMMAGFGGESDIEIPQPFLDRQSKMIASLGQLLGEEILYVLRQPERIQSKISIRSEQITVTFPGRERTNTGREGAAGTYVDGDDVNVKLSLLVLGDIAIAGVNAEVYTVIGEKLKKESPYNHTIFSSITNGAANSGYIPSDDAFQRYTFQVLGSRLKPNYAERGIIDGLVGMMEKSRNNSK